MWNWIVHHGKRIARITSCVVLILVGLFLMIPGIPGPGILVVFAGLSILAVDFVWAHRLKTKMKETGRKMVDKVRGKPADEVTMGISVADELERLSQLAKNELLTPDEWVRAKEMFLGKSPNRREDALDSLQRLHDLYNSGALSQSEFNMKKWDVLSKSDV